MRFCRQFLQPKPSETGEPGAAFKTNLAPHFGAMSPWPMTVNAETSWVQTMFWSFTIQCWGEGLAQASDMLTMFEASCERL